MDKPGISIGHTSDLASLRGRSDWSEINAALKALEPGTVVTLTCPSGKSMKAFRSMIITSGRRFHKGGEWKMATRTAGGKLHCFLAPSA